RGLHVGKERRGFFDLASSWNGWRPRDAKSTDLESNGCRGMLPGYAAAGMEMPSAGKKVVPIREFLCQRRTRAFRACKNEGGQRFLGGTIIRCKVCGQF